MYGGSLGASKKPTKTHNEYQQDDDFFSEEEESAETIYLSRFADYFSFNGNIRKFRAS